MSSSGAELLAKLFLEFPTQQGAKAVGLCLFYYIHTEEVARTYPGDWVSTDAWMPKRQHLHEALQETKRVLKAVRKTAEEMGIPAELFERIKSRVCALSYTDQKAMANQLPTVRGMLGLLRPRRSTQHSIN